MNVLHLAAGNRWTGAAATAFADAEALRGAGVNAHYAYVGGYTLERKIGSLPWTHAVIEKAQNPVSFLRTAGAIRRLVEREGIDIVHAHLTWDHALARLAAGDRARIARTFHARRVLRNDPLSRILISGTPHLCVINESFRDIRAIRGRGVIFTPPPLDVRQFSPAGPDVRAFYGFGGGDPVVAAIGKITHDRGWEAVLETFAALRTRVPRARLMIIGHGPHRPALELRAAALSIAEAVTWAGYHEDDLAEHYRTADLLLFTARGSDEGHRAVIEAQACGVPVASYPLDGITALVDARGVAAASIPESLAATSEALLREDREALRREATDRAARFAYPEAAARLIAAYESV